MKILIVDDEPNTRKGLRDLVDWPSVGIDEILTAGDGLEALELVKSFVPDLLLCDVRMPRMNGVELVGRLREEDRFQKMQVVFLSGFSDKEYLKAAIRYQALEYLEKPVDIIQVEEVLARAVEKRIKSIEEKVDDRLLEELAQGDPDATAKVEAMWGKGSSYRAVCIGLQPRETVSGDDRPERLASVLNGIFPHMLLSQQQPWLWLALVAGSRPQLDSERLKKTLAELLEDTDAYPPAAIAAGATVDRAAEIPRSIDEAQGISHSFFYDGYGRLYLKSLPHAGDSRNLDALYDRMMDILSNRRYDALPDLIEHMKQELSAIRIPPRKARMFVLEVLLGIRHSLYTWQPKAFPIIPEEWLQETLDHLPMLEDAFRFLIDNIEIMHKAVRHTLDHEELAPRIRRYIDEQYAGLVTLETLAEVFHYSPNYLSTIFKKETNIGICRYLMKVRIEQAKRMLGSSNLRPNEVSQKVGFQDYAHFSRVFKRIEGIGPRKWKQRNKP